MKKMIAVLMASVLTLSFGSMGPVYAQEAAADTTVQEDAGEELPEVKEGDITVSLPGDLDLDFKKRDPESMSLPTSDVVTIDGNNYQITTDNVVLNLALDPSLGYMVLTQDLTASIQNYWIYEDPEAMCDFLIESGVHICAVNTYTTSVASILTLGSDIFSKQVGSMNSSRSEALLQGYALLLATNTGFTDYELGIYGDHAWVVINGDTYLTIENGQYIGAKCENLEGGVTEDDRLDMQDFLSCLTISGR
ncbi:MAG: hypothetical protein IKE03_06650 [Blautia sp.]|nr:hypothetical protein [Blautia sp.]